MPHKALDVAELAWCCDQAELGFTTSDELDDLAGCIGQERATDAIELALAIRQPGYNIFALGPEGIGKHTTAKRLLDQAAAANGDRLDLCYVSNFTTPHKPISLVLPAGIGAALTGQFNAFVGDVLDAIKNAFENDEYRARRQVIDEHIKQTQNALISEVEADAKAKDVALIRSPNGLAFAPMKDGKAIDAETFGNLDQATQKAIEETVEALQKQLQDALSSMPKMLRQGRERVRQLNDNTSAFAVNYLIENLRSQFAEQPSILNYIDAVRADIIDKVEVLLAGIQSDEPNPPPEEHPILRRYLVNLLVDNAGGTGAPVIVEDDPSFERLFGRIEHRAEMGALVTDTSMIRAGALHRANGGYLMLDARKLLTMPMAYEGLKRALNTEQIRMQSPQQMMGGMSTATLEPEPIPLSVKVVIVGERQYYYTLSNADPEFTRLFKIAADFDEFIDRDAASALLVARMLAGVGRRDKLNPLTACGTARLLEEAARAAGDQHKLSVDIDRLQDILREADHYSRKDGHSTIDHAAVHKAVDARTRRLDRVRERSHEQIEQGTVNIVTDGAEVGQINGLSVLQIGDFAFGKPTRISARVRVGAGQLIDIEREAKLGGPLHTKGLLILSGLISARFAADTPLSMRASLVFEQSYGGVDGDSASSTEYYALISALSGVPIKQGLAVTGAIDQYGNVQAIGGVNEKIEGFFDLCASRGLTGNQGVLIPTSNVRHLMLHQRVRDAAAQQKFHIFAVDHVDQGIELLTGETAGATYEDGSFQAGSINARAAAKLLALAEARRAFGLPDSEPALLPRPVS